MEMFLLVQGVNIKDGCSADSSEQAKELFILRGFRAIMTYSNVISEADYLTEMQQNAFENQSTEF